MPTDQKPNARVSEDEIAAARASIASAVPILRMRGHAGLASGVGQAYDVLERLSAMSARVVIRDERVAAIKRAAAVNLQLEEAGTNTVAKAALRDVLEVVEAVDALNAQLSTAEAARDAARATALELAAATAESYSLGPSTRVAADDIAARIRRLK